MAHLQDPRNLGHGKSATVGRPDRLVSISTQLVAALLKFLLALSMLLGECRQASFSLGCLALASSDSKIVGRIPATRLAQTDQMTFVHEGWQGAERGLCLRQNTLSVW